MNVQRIAAIAAIAGAVLGGASIVALGAAAYNAGQPRAELASAAGDDSADRQAARSDQPGDGRSGSQLASTAGSDANSPEYNPYLDPLSDGYVTPEARSEWLGKQAVIRECMAAAGFDYLEWQWWLGGSPQPTGFDFETSVLWTQALSGPDVNRPGGGCAEVGDKAEADARAAGQPLGAVETPVDPEAPTERETWLAFQQLVRDCMAEAGHEYLYWEWWNPDGAGARPMDLTEAETAEWNLALDGNAGGGAAYRWEDAGCWGRAVHESGNDNMH